MKEGGLRFWDFLLMFLFIFLIFIIDFFVWRVRENELINCCEDIIWFVIVLIFDDFCYIIEINYLIFKNLNNKIVFGLTFLNDSSFISNI